MNQLSYLDAIILGAVQGLTEFLPISSSAHLAFVQRWLGLQADSPQMFLLDGITHVATLASIAVVFAPRISRFLSSFFRDLSLRYQGRRSALRIALLGIVACIPTAAIGLFFKDELEAAFGRPRWIGVELMLTGVMLAVLGMIPRGRGGIAGFRWWHAFLIGTAQGVAILPGISRSGATIATAEFLGIRRRWAAEFSFLIAFPAILGAAALTFREIFQTKDQLVGGIGWGPLMVAGAIAFVLGVVTLRMLVQAVRRARLHYFSVYCMVVGGLVTAGFL